MFDQNNIKTPELFGREASNGCIDQRYDNAKNCKQANIAKLTFEYNVIIGLWYSIAATIFLQHYNIMFKQAL